MGPRTPRWGSQLGSHVQEGDGTGRVGGGGTAAPRGRRWKAATGSSLCTSRKHKFTTRQSREAGNSSCPCFEERKIAFLGVQRKGAAALKEDPHRHQTPPTSKGARTPGPIFEMKLWPRTFSRVSTGDSGILSSCDMNDEHA